MIHHIFIMSNKKNLIKIDKDKDKDKLFTNQKIK